MSSPCHADADIFTCGKEAVRHGERPWVSGRVDLEVADKESKGETKKKTKQESGFLISSGVLRANPGGVDAVTDKRARGGQVRLDSR